MARKRIGKMDSNTLLLIGGLGIVAVYMLTRTQAVAVNPGATTLVTGPGGQYLLPGNTTAQDITAGSQGVSNILNSLNNAGIFG